MGHWAPAGTGKRALAPWEFCKVFSALETKLTCSLLTSTLSAFEVLPRNAFDKSTYLLTYLFVHYFHNFLERRSGSFSSSFGLC